MEWDTETTWYASRASKNIRSILAETHEEMALFSAHLIRFSNNALMDRGNQSRAVDFEN